MIQIEVHNNGYQMAFKFPGTGERGYVVQARTLEEVHAAIEHHMGMRHDIKYPAKRAYEHRVLAGHINDTNQDCPLCRMDGSWDETEAGDHDRIKAWLKHVGGNKQGTMLVDAAWKTFIDTEEAEVLSILTNATDDDPGINDTFAYMARFHKTLRAFSNKNGGKTIKAALAMLSA